MRNWYNVELPKEYAEVLKKYCKDKGLRYEASECFNLIHIEAYLTPLELAEINAFIDNNC